MKKLNNNNLKLAIQKKGRLTEESITFLRLAGLEFESYQQRLFSTCRNFPLEILYVRDDDIPDYVSSGTVDLGIVGQNILYESEPDVNMILRLEYGYCSLAVAAMKDSKIKTVKDLKNKTVATSYPNATKKFFKSKNIPVEIVKIKGSVEITPALGVSQAIVDLISTGSTLALNDLTVIEKVYDSQAVFIANKKACRDKKVLVNKLLMRFQGVLSAKNYKYIMINAPKSILPKIKTVVPGLKSPTIAPLAKKDWISIQSVVKEDVFWETIEKLKMLGATGIIVLPIEKMIA